MYQAQLVGVYTVGEIPGELAPFLNLQARREKRELRMGEKVAVFQVVGTQSFIVAFLATLKSVEEMEARLKQQETKLDPTSHRALERVLGEVR